MRRPQSQTRGYKYQEEMRRHYLQCSNLYNEILYSEIFFEQAETTDSINSFVTGAAQQRIAIADKQSKAKKGPPN